MKRTSLWEGWSLTGIAALLLALMTGLILLLRGADVEGLRLLVRDSARTSLLLFCMVFSATPAVQLWPNRFTRWQRRNRRQLALSFVLSHLLHGTAITLFALQSPAVFQASTHLPALILAGICYLFVILMAITSFDYTARWLGTRWWRRLHRTGLWYIWSIFLFSETLRALNSPLYWSGTALLLAACSLRVMAWSAARKPTPATPRHESAS